MPRILLTLLLSLAAAGSADAQQVAELSDEVRGWVEGSVYEVTVRTVLKDAATVEFVKELGLAPYDRLSRVERTVRYLDRIEAIDNGRVTNVTRHYLLTREVSGLDERVLPIEARRVLIGVSPTSTHGALWTFASDRADTELDKQQTALLDSTLFSPQLSEWGGKTRAETLFNFQVSAGWPPKQYLDEWPGAVVRLIDPNFASVLRQGTWDVTLRDPQPTQATLTMNMFGDVETEEDGIPVTVHRNREIELTCKTRLTERDLPDSVDSYLAEARALHESGKLDEARARVKLAVDLQPPQHLESVIDAFKAELEAGE